MTNAEFKRLIFLQATKDVYESNTKRGTPRQRQEAKKIYDDFMKRMKEEGIKLK